MTPKEKVQDTYVQMRIDKELKEKAEKAARNKGISLAGYIRMCLIESIEKEEAKSS